MHFSTTWRVISPDSLSLTTILAWYRRLVAQKFDGSKYREYPGRPTVEPKLEGLVVRMARENSGWGYDRIVGALANLGYTVSDQTVGNILRRHGIAPAPKRSQITTWKDFLATHMSVLAGADFFTVEVLSWRGLVTYYVLFFLHLESRRVNIAGITRHPDQEWMEQVGRRGEMNGVVYRSEVRIERVKGPMRKAYLPAEPTPVIFGVHGAVAEHYKVSPTVSEPHATTLDYIVAAAAG